jgi:hypothetical protein
VDDFAREGGGGEGRVPDGWFSLQPVEEDWSQEPLAEISDIASMS